MKKRCPETLDLVNMSIEKRSRFLPYVYKRFFFILKIKTSFLVFVIFYPNVYYIYGSSEDSEVCVPFKTKHIFPVTF